MTQRIALLRKSLNTSSSEIEYISSIRNIGYRWVPEIHILDNKSPNKKWLGIMNKLYNSFINKESSERTLQLIQEMEDYTEYHFFGH